MLDYAYIDQWSEAVAQQATGGWALYDHEPGRYGQQRRAELAAVLAFLAPRLPRRVVEIGTHDSGTLWAWGQLTPEDPSSQVFGVDVTDENIRMENFKDLAPRQADLFLGDSTDSRTIDQVRNELNGPIDFLFIDADHTREKVVEDYLAWSPLVADDGVIGFHDTMIAAEHGWKDVLAMQTDTLAIEFMRKDDDIVRCGIGLLIKGTQR